MSRNSHVEFRFAERADSASKARTSSTKRGDEFEATIFDHFAQEIAEGRFYAKSECCRLRRKPKYFSRDRASEITFDISIEFRLPGVTDYFSVVLIECKNYTHAVPVDDAEEFFAKVQQVAGANAKAVIASTASFQAGAIEFARSKGIGLLRFVPPKDCKWVLQRSAATNTEADAFEDGCDVGAGLSQQDFRSDVFSFYLRSPRRDTYSLRTFFEDILLNAISQKQLRRLSSPKREKFLVAPFRSKDELEDFATSVHEKLHYAGGHVPLDALCDMERERTGLRVQLAVEPTLESIERQVLGRIDFRELRSTFTGSAARTLVVPDSRWHTNSRTTCWSTDVTCARSGATPRTLRWSANRLFTAPMSPAWSFKPTTWQRVFSFQKIRWLAIFGHSLLN